MSSIINKLTHSEEKTIGTVIVALTAAAAGEMVSELWRTCAVRPSYLSAGQC